MENIYIEKNIFLDINLKTREEVLSYISNKAIELGIFDNSKNLLEAFYKREDEFTTGLEDGFAIPHAKVKGVKNASIICVRTEKEVEWDSLDGKPIKVIIALIIPENASEEHLNAMSNIAKKLINENVKKDLKSAKNSSDFLKALKTETAKFKVESLKENKDSLNVVAITACVVGVAHTYMAEDKLILELSKAGHNIRVETQGSKGVGTPLTNKEIENADIVIIAADTKVNLDRFNNKIIYSTHVARAIKEPLKVLSDAQKNGTIHTSADFATSAKNAGDNQGVLQHILAGISYMIPVIIMGGICLAFSIGIAKALWGSTAGTGGPLDADGNPLYPWNPLAVMDKIGGAAFTLMIPILAGFIANSIAGRAAIAPAMLGGFIGNDATKFMPLPGMTEVTTPTGFIGAIISGLLVGYFVKFVNTWNVHKSLKAVMPIFFIPLTAGIGISILFIYVIGGPIGYVMEHLSNAIKSGYQSENFGVGLGIGLGVLLGAMASFDMGGPINKIAFVTCSALVTLKDPVAEPMGAMAAAIPVAPLGMGLTTLLFQRFFTKEEKGMGISAIIMGTIGISEGAIPFAIRDPKRAIISNVLGGMIAGGIAGAFQITNLAAHGGPIVAILGAVPYGWQTVVFFVAVAAGVAVTTLIYGTLLITSKGKIGSLKEFHLVFIEKIIQGYSSKKDEINEEIQVLKSQQALARSQSENDKIETKLENLKKVKQSLDSEKQRQILLAKNSYISLKLEEVKIIKNNKVKIDEFMKNAKKIKQDSIKDLKNSKKTKFSSLDKFEKKAYIEKYSKNLDTIKWNYEKSILDYQLNLREKVIKNYNLENAKL